MQPVTIEALDTVSANIREETWIWTLNPGHLIQGAILEFLKKKKSYSEVWTCKKSEWLYCLTARSSGKVNGQQSHVNNRLIQSAFITLTCWAHSTYIHLLIPAMKLAARRETSYSMAPLVAACWYCKDPHYEFLQLLLLKLLTSSKLFKIATTIECCHRYER